MNLERVAQAIRRLHGVLLATETDLDALVLELEERGVWGAAAGGTQFTCECGWQSSHGAVFAVRDELRDHARVHHQG
ncbi:MAG: hypothetical protein KGL39_29905 [Patescibacteria group bacterium]|nr:hypothetical protein [Patescibacteria group bacterium]